MKTTADDLRKALALLRNGAGWLKGSPNNATKCYCAVIAINLTSPDHSRGARVHGALKNSVEALQGPGETAFGLVDWNDRPSTTWANVKAAYELAIKNEENEA
jgi:hypothetical protein